VSVIATVKRILRRITAKPHAVILTYHSVLEEPAPFMIWHYLDRHQLEDQFARLARAGNCISMKQLLEDLRSNRLSSNSVVITFDDGFANNLKTVLPLLEKYRLPATFFISSGFMGANKLMWPEIIACVLAASPLKAIKFADMELAIGSPEEKTASYKKLTRRVKQVPAQHLQAELDELAAAADVTPAMLQSQSLAKQSRMMSWDELRQMAASPWVEIGAHTVNHYRLSELSDEQVYNEIVESKHELEAQVGPVNYFAYPYGGKEDFLERHKHLAAKAGFTAAFSSEATCAVVGSDMYAIPRLGVGGDGSAESIEYAATGGLAIQNGLTRWA
jgi:peptidoglycan/xylan/chitin deacetylase (PgdA/CDA1 family)